MNSRKIYVYKTLFWMLLVTGASAILLYCFSTGISGNDFWWHAKTGEWICSNRAIPNKDIYSWYGVEHGFDWRQTGISLSLYKYGRYYDAARCQ